MIKILRNFAYTITSNLLNFLVITLVTLIVPKIIGVSDYGYWQLYIFYTTYVGIFHLGWIDGIYLRYGGKDYSKLDFDMLKSEIIYFSFFQLIVAVLFLMSIHIFSTGNTGFILNTTVCYLFLTNIRQLFLYILQDTSRIKEYATIIIFDRIIYIIIIVLALFIGVKAYQVLILGDLIAKLLSLFYVIYICRELFSGKLLSHSLILNDIKSNISIGSKLLIANFAGTLIVGVIRYGIKYGWGVKTFGKIALTLSISNALMLFITAISLVLFPMLRKVNKAKLNLLYIDFRELLMFILFFCLCFYFPLNTFMVRWLPKYQDALKYLSFLFPIFIYEGKFDLLVNTFMKTLRMEKLLLITNMVSLVISVIVTLLNLFLIHNLDFMMLSVIIILAFRSTLGELIVTNKMNIHILKDVVLEFAILGIFIFGTWLLNDLQAFLLYIVVMMAYLLIKLKFVLASYYRLIKIDY